MSGSRCGVFSYTRSSKKRPQRLPMRAICGSLSSRLLVRVVSPETWKPSRRWSCGCMDLSVKTSKAECVSVCVHGLGNQAHVVFIDFEEPEAELVAPALRVLDKVESVDQRQDRRFPRRCIPHV